jgi:hypothetical protein
MMNLQQIGLSASIACALVTGIVAQTSSIPPAVTPPDQMTAITVTGCLQRDTTPAAATIRETVGTSGAQPSVSFVLADARASEASTATPEAVLVTSTVTAYRLSGDDEEVTQLVGRSVEISGTVDQKDDAIQRAGNGTTGAAARPKLTIITLKKTTGTCSN